MADLGQDAAVTQISASPSGDLPRLPIESLLRELVDRASEMIEAQDRLRGLLAANRSIVGELSLPAVLRAVVEAARQIGGAQYAALGVIGADGTLEQFVHVGMDQSTVATIGELPTGRGVLGALIDHPEPIRLSTIAHDSRSSGFPTGHPPMKSFLGVPISSRNSVFGNLYLTDRSDGQDFSPEDEEVILALAATAGIAIENARLYEESRRRQEWLRASGEISRALLADSGDGSILMRIAESVKRLADADTVTVVFPDPDNPELLLISVATGLDEQELTGLRYPAAGTTAGTAIECGHGTMTHAVDTDHGVYPQMKEPIAVGPVMALPLTGEWNPRGAIVVGRARGRHPFTSEDLQMADAFASQAAIALELADSRADQQRLTVLEDRDRIARDLHDHVIQRLFAAGLSVQSAATAVDDTVLQQRLSRTVNDLDDTIAQIRTSIFALRDPGDTRTVRSAVIKVLREISEMLAETPTLQFIGAVDTLVDDSLIGDIEAVVRESLTNVAKHAQADQIDVVVEADLDRLTVLVTDNGIGIHGNGRRSGLANLRDRAEEHGGNLTLTNLNGEGLQLRWTIPLR
jgi:signal transduction histidine kinase